MSRTKSGQLIKQAARPRSDAGSAGYRPLRDGVSAKPASPAIDPGSSVETAKVVRELESFGAVAAPVEPTGPKRRMVQEDLFASLGVKV